MKILLYCAVVVALISCSSGPDEEPRIALKQPDHFPAATYTFENNPLTKDGFELGRMLFYDPILSSDSTVTCSTCHLQAVAFSDPVHKISVGVHERVGTRNAPPIFNLAFKNSFFWDGGVNHVDFIPVNALNNPNELDQDLEHLVQKLQRHYRYPEKFRQAFGKNEINSQQVLFALSQFMASVISAGTRYDQYVTGDPAALSAQEVSGLHLVESKCGDCHKPPLFTNDSFANNGLDDVFKDTGRAVITEWNEDAGKFRVPSLRNVELTAPYMHDGRFRNLEAVLDHYQHGVKMSATLDSRLHVDDKLGIALTEQEKSDIIAFLKTLTDKNFTQDVRFSNPFLQ